MHLPGSDRRFTLGDALLAADGSPGGFDYLRLFLAYSVIVVHSVVISYGDAADVRLWSGILHGPVAMILPAFFALSGYLIAGSLLRTPRLTTFYLFRVLRLLPALAVEVLLSAFVLGLFFTTLPAGEYLTSPGLARYFGNMVGWVDLYLPGVFLANPDPGKVNQSLWTLPYELECYVGIGILFMLGIVRRPPLLLATIAVLTVALLIKNEVVDRIFILQIEPRLLVLDFLCGVAVFAYRDRLPQSVPLGLASLLVAMALSYDQRTSYVFPPFVAYAVAVFGSIRARRVWPVATGDYSYGIYLYAFPLQQAWTALMPGARIWWLNSLVAMAGSSLIAAASWHLIEKPVLKLRRRFQPRRTAPDTMDLKAAGQNPDHAAAPSAA